jgi:hypothetical protein
LTDRFLPQLRHLGLGSIAICLSEGAKRLPIFDPVTMSLLVALRRVDTACHLTSLQPTVKRVPTDIEHLTDVTFPFTSVNRGNHFRA